MSNCLTGNGKITDIALKMISRGCPDLSHICFIDCAKLTDQSLKALGSCKGVRVLNVADCVRYAYHLNLSILINYLKY